MIRKIVICLPLTFFLFTVAIAQTQPPKIPRIGYLTSFGGRSGRQVNAFQQGWRELGYLEGKNILIEYRHPKGNVGDAPQLVRQLLQLKVDVLVAVDPTAIRAAKQATKTIPIVMLTNQDPVAVALVKSFGASRRERHGHHSTHPRIERKTAGGAQGGPSFGLARWSPLGSSDPHWEL